MVQYCVYDHLSISPSDLDTREKKGNSALHLALEKNQVKAVSFLLEKGAKTYLLNDAHMAPLHLAVDLGKEDIMQVRGTMY